MLSRGEIRDEISDAIRIGLGDGYERSVYEPDRNLVFVKGHADPIVVKDNDVDLPDDLANLAPGIRLDVQAIMSERRNPKRR